MKHVKKLLKLGHSFDGEDDRVLRIRDEYLETQDPSYPTLSAAEADKLVANLSTLPRLGITLLSELPAASWQPTPTLTADVSAPQDSLRDEPSLSEQRRAPLITSPEPLETADTSLTTSRPRKEAPQNSPTSSSDESSELELLRHPKRVRTPTPPITTQLMFADDSDTDFGIVSPIYYRSRFEIPATEKTAVPTFQPAALPASFLYEKRPSNPQDGANPRS